MPWSGNGIAVQPLSRDRGDRVRRCGHELIQWHEPGPRTPGNSGLGACESRFGATGRIVALPSCPDIYLYLRLCAYQGRTRYVLAVDCRLGACVGSTGRWP
jgi:hypothetical protein